MNPMDVYAMGCRKFADLQEHMFLHHERVASLNSGDDYPSDDGAKIYTGPKNRK